MVLARSYKIPQSVPVVLYCSGHTACHWLPWREVVDVVVAWPKTETAVMPPHLFEDWPS